MRWKKVKLFMIRPTSGRREGKVDVFIKQSSILFVYCEVLQERTDW